MRVVLVLLLLFLPPASALVLEDPAGDTRLLVNGVAQPVPADRYAAVDVVGLDVAETRDQVTFILHVDDAAPDLIPLAESTTHTVSWRLGAVLYDLRIVRNTDTETGVLASGTAAWLDRYDEGDDRFFRSDRLDVEVDPEANTYTVTVPRADLMDQSGAPALPGTTLGYLHVVSEGTFFDFADIANQMLDMLGSPFGVDPPDVQATVRDRMPDAGVGAYEVRLGGGENHGIGLSASEPSRASNGEATTMLFTLHLRNDQPEPLPVHFRADGVPDGWDVWFPAEGVRVEPDESRDVPVLARMPFVHQHGTRSEFTVRAEQAGDESVYGETTLAVVFTEVPQPSGHHPRLWLHTATTPDVLLFEPVVLGDRVAGYMNAAEEHGEDAPLRPTRYFGDQYAPGWDLPLHPGLGMGLDLDATATGRLELPVRTGAQPMTGTSLHGRLLHVDAAGNETLLATLADDAGPVDLAGDTAHTFTATLTPVADRVPYTPRAGLVLQAWLDRPDEVEQTVGIIMGTDVELTPGGILDLPLLEYHDEVTGAFADLQTLRIEAEVRERLVNPGEVTVFPVRVVNQGPDDHALTLRLRGDDGGWATVSPERVTVPAGASVPALVSVRVPDDARDGEQADMVLEAEGDDGLRSLLRLVARVDTTADHVDLSDQVPTASVKESPGIPLSLVAAVVGVLALAGRRRAP